MEMSTFVAKEMRMMRKTFIRALFKKPSFLPVFFRFVVNQSRGMSIRNKYQQKGIHIPPELLLSVTNACNLQCAGCYARANNETRNDDRKEMGIADFERILNQTQSAGIRLMTILGGEPFLRSELLELFLKFPGINFIVYTNGTLFTKAHLALIKKAKNIHVCFSIEGDKKQTDDRRGAGIYDSITKQMSWFQSNRIFFAASITVSMKNVDTVTDESFMASLIEKGVSYINFVEYEAMASDDQDLVLSEEARALFVKTLQHYQSLFPTTYFTAFPSFEYASGGCLAAGRGFFHVNAYGDAEPCNFVPISDTSLLDTSVIDAINSPLFKQLRGGSLIDNPGAGECALLSRKEELAKIKTNQ